jgi:hypothetical protein
MSSLRFCLPEETNLQRPDMVGATDSSNGQHGAFSWRADMPEGACSQLYWTTSCLCRNWVRSSRIQINASNTIQPCRRNDEQGKWEHIAMCRNVHQASQVARLVSEYRERDCMQPSSKDTTSKCKPRWEGNIKMDLTEVGCKFVDLIHVIQDRDQCGMFRT